MAVKNSMTKIYDVPFYNICAVLRQPDFSQCVDAVLVEEAILPDGVEFRFVRKTTMTRYGRNYFVRLVKVNDEQTSVTITTQSRKYTVLWDTSWKNEVNRTFGFIDLLLRR